MALRLLKITLTTLLVFLLATAIWIGTAGKDLFRTATGSVSRSLCAATFVSQVDPQQTFREEQLPLMRGIGWAIANGWLVRHGRSMSGRRQTVSSGRPPASICNPSRGRTAWR